MVYSGGLCSGDGSHAHFGGTLGQMAQYPFAVPLLEVVLPLASGWRRWPQLQAAISLPMPA